MSIRGLKVETRFWVGEGVGRCFQRRITRERVPTIEEAKRGCLQLQSPLLLPALQRKSTRAKRAVHRYVLLIGFRIEG